MAAFVNKDQIYYGRKSGQTYRACLRAILYASEFGSIKFVCNNQHNAKRISEIIKHILEPIDLRINHERFTFIFPNGNKLRVISIHELKTKNRTITKIIDDVYFDSKNREALSEMEMQKHEFEFRNKS